MSNEVELTALAASQSNVAKPVCRIFYNKRSGGKEVTDLREMLEKKSDYTPYMQDLMENQCTVLATTFKQWSEEQKQGQTLDARVVVAGGDGTVNWVLHEMARHDWQASPHVALFPMGTGNDAARYFGYGPRLAEEAQVLHDLEYIFGARDKHQSEAWDRWNLFIVNHDEKSTRDKLFKRAGLNISAEEFAAAVKGNHPFVHGYDKSHANAEVQAVATATQATTTTSASNPDLPEHVTLSPTAIADAVSKPDAESREFSEGKQPESTPVEGDAKEDLAPASSAESTAKVQSNDSLEPVTNPTAMVLPTAEAQPSKELVPAPESPYYHVTFYNYFSLGIDAQTMHSLEVNRTDCAGCHRCRCCTMTCIGLLNTRDCCCCRNPAVRITVDFLVPRALADQVESTPHKPKGPNGPAELEGADFNDDYVWVPQGDLSDLGGNAFVLTNLPGYAAGRSAWGKVKDEKQAKDRVHYTQPNPGDGKLEFSMFEGYNHIAQMTLCGSRAHRLGVVEGVRFNIRGEIYAQFDGEAWKQRYGSILVLRGKPIDIIRGNTEVTCC